jgi:hypothetical protein
MKDSSRVRVLFNLLILASMAAAGMDALKADSFSLSAQAQVFTGGQGGNCPATGPVSSACSGNYSYSLGGNSLVTLSGTAAATAGFGDLHAGSSALTGCIDSAPYNCLGVSGVLTFGTSSFSDSFAISGGPLAGYLDFSVRSDGIVGTACSGPDEAFCNATAQGILTGGQTAAGAVLFNGTSGNYLLGTGSKVVTVWVPFNQLLETPNIELLLSASSVCGVGNNTSCSSTADFLDTVYVTGLSVLDANGDPVSGADVIAASGTNYNDIQGIAAPEPPTLALVLAGIGCGVCLYCRMSARP